MITPHLTMKTLLATAGLLALTAFPAAAFPLVPTDSIGNVRTYQGEPFLYLSSGAKARSITSLNAFLGFRMPYGVSGSAAIFDLTPGRYSMTWKMMTNPNEASDELFLWNGAFSSLATSSEADQWHEDGSNRVVTDWRTTEFESFGRVILIALDGDRRFDTTMKIDSIEAVESAGVPEPSMIGGLIVGSIAILRRGRQCKP